MPLSTADRKGERVMPKGYIDCRKCKWSNKLYDFTGKWTGSLWCVKRNGKLRKRYRGECKYVKESEE